MASSHPPRTGSLGLGLVLGVAAGIAVVVPAWLFLVPMSAVPAATATPSVSSTAVVESPTPTEAASTPTPSPTPTPDGIVTTLPSGSWVTVLKSLRQSSVSAEQAQQEASKLATDKYTPVVLDTNAFGNLNPGYWAVVIPGFSSRAESDAVCDELGLGVGNSCFSREI